MWNFEKNLPFKSYGVKKPICKRVMTHREPFSRSFGTNETQQLREGQLVGRMLLQRLATGATAVKQARYRYTARHSTRMRSIIHGPWHLLFNGVPPRVLHFCAFMFYVILKRLGDRVTFS